MTSPVEGGRSGAATEPRAIPRLVPGERILSTDGAVGGTIKSEVNEYGNVLVHWDDGLRGWSQARLVVEVREVSPVVSDPEEEARAEIADAAYMKGRADALGSPLSVDEIAERQEVWLPIERALVAQDRIAGPPEENYDPHVTSAANPEDVAREVLRAAEPKLRARAVLEAAREAER